MWARLAAIVLLPTLGCVVIHFDEAKSESSGEEPMSGSMSESDASPVSGGAQDGAADQGATSTTDPAADTTSQATSMGAESSSGAVADTAGPSGDPSTGGSTETGAFAPACDAMYGAAPGYILCEETATECAFNATTSGTCNAMCAMFGGTCLEAFDNPAGNQQECTVIRPNMDTCDTVRMTELCVCDKGG